MHKASFCGGAVAKIQAIMSYLVGIFRAESNIEPKLYKEMSAHIGQNEAAILSKKISDNIAAFSVSANTPVNSAIANTTNPPTSYDASASSSKSLTKGAYDADRPSEDSDLRTWPIKH
jgi:hypothetical protein